LEKTMRRQVFPQAPSPTITSFRRISVMVCSCYDFFSNGVSRIKTLAGFVSGEVISYDVECRFVCGGVM
jgi:hypothetical protein